MTQWVCNDCGNTEKFEGEIEVKKWTQQTVQFRGEDQDNYEVIDEYDDDEEIENGLDEEHCPECQRKVLEAL